MKRLRKPPLTQAQIDRPELPPVSRRTASWLEVLEYLDGQPGPLWTCGTLALIATIIVALFYFCK